MKTARYIVRQVKNRNTQYQQATPLDCHTGSCLSVKRQLVREESLKPLKKWKEKKRMLQFIGGLVIGGIFGVVLMCLLQINKTG